VSAGPRAGDEDPGTLRQLNAHRASMGLSPELRSVSRSRQALEESYPDLRQVLRTAEGGPAEETTPPRVVEPIAGLSAAGFGLAGAVEYRDDGQALPPAAA